MNTARNQVARGWNDAIVTAPETATAPRREPQSRLYSTNVACHAEMPFRRWGHSACGKLRKQEACLMTPTDPDYLDPLVEQIMREMEAVHQRDPDREQELSRQLRALFAAMELGRGGAS